MNTKHFLAMLSLFAGFVPSLRAADAPAIDPQATDTPVILAEAQSMQAVVAPASVTMSKSREQVIGEFVEAVKDGSYIPPSEIYPMISTGLTQR